MELWTSNIFFNKIVVNHSSYYSKQQAMNPSVKLVIGGKLVAAQQFKRDVVLFFNLLCFSKLMFLLFLFFELSLFLFTFFSCVQKPFAESNC